MSARRMHKGPGERFQMPIDDVSVIAGRGTLVQGRIQHGAIKTGDTVKIAGAGATQGSTVVLAIEMSGKRVDRANAGDSVGVLLRAVGREDVTRGQVLRSP